MKHPGPSYQHLYQDDTKSSDLCRGRSCRGRGWCSRETRQAVVQLVLLCVASCSWTLLLISLTLTTSATTPRHSVKVLADEGPRWAQGGADACQECLSRRGAPKTYWQVFERSLHQIATALDRLDQPLAPPALRTHLRATRTLLQRLASVLHLPLIGSSQAQGSREFSHESILAAPGQVDGRLACPDQFIGPKAGYPRYHTGYFSINCSSLPLREVVTAVLWDIEKEHLHNLLDGFKRIYPGMPILLVTSAEVESSPNVQVEKPRPSTTGAVKRVLSYVQTPYVFLGTKLVEMNNHSRLERLVWVAEWSGVWAVGGAAKGQDGRWRAGCLQVDQGGGQLLYTRGYTTSLFECQLCQGIDAPFVMRTEAIKKLDWPKSGLEPRLLMPNMFLDIHAKARPYKQGAVLCPDSMFLVLTIDPSWDVGEGPQHRRERELRKVAAMWHPVAKKKKLARLQLPSGLMVNYPCDFLPSSRQSLSTRFSPSTSDKGITAEWGCHRKEVVIIISNLLRACSKLQARCHLMGTAAEVLLSGGNFQGLPNRTISFGASDRISLSHLQQQLEVSYYVAFVESMTLVIEGRWWTVKVSYDHHILHKKWLSLEMLDGVWVQTARPGSAPWKGGGDGSCGVAAFHVEDTSEEERLSDFSTPSCHQNRFSDMTLRSSN